MPCNKPRPIREGEPGYGVKQNVVKGCEDSQETIVQFGDATMENRSDDPERRANFRARHGCDEGKLSKRSAKYWSCKDW